MPKTGRPEVKIDKKIFENLCELWCTEREIAHAFGCSVDTLNKWCKKTYKNERGKSMTFSDVRLKYADAGKVSLRRYQMNLAKRDARMAIFLGKNELGQSDYVAAQRPVDDTKDDALSAALRELAQELEGGKGN